MPEFKSWKSYKVFEEAVRILGSRHNLMSAVMRGGPSIHDTESFLEVVRSTGLSRSKHYPAGTCFWRAQLGCDLAEGGRQPYSADRMKPTHRRARSGRVNPKGTAVLYLATDRDTAISEIRPEPNSYVSVACFETRRDLTVVNCISSCVIVPDDDTGREPPAKQREDYVWAMIDNAFSRPVALGDKVAEYVPTQIIAGLFKKENRDGIVYRSWLSNGENVALFDLRAADAVSRHLFKVTGTEYYSREDKPPRETFHGKLLRLYKERCAVTACGPYMVLEATHIWPYAGPDVDDPDNGLLLRTDIRRLFNDGLLRIHPDTLKVHLNREELGDTEYWSLNGRPLQMRSDGKQPGREYLQKRWDWDEERDSAIRNLIA